MGSRTCHQACQIVPSDPSPDRGISYIETPEFSNAVLRPLTKHSLRRSTHELLEIGLCALEINFTEYKRTDLVISNIGTRLFTLTMFCTSTTCFGIGSLLLTFVAISGLLVYITTCIHAYLERDQGWDGRFTLSRLIVNVSPKLSKVNRHRHSESLDDLLARFRNQSCPTLKDIDISEQLRELNDEGGKSGARTEVFLLGDSTVRNKFEYLDKLVYSSNCDVPYQIRVIDRHQSSCTNVFGTRFYYEPVGKAKELVAALDHLEDYWLGYEGNLVIIFNIGLHELHLYSQKS